VGRRTAVAVYVNGAFGIRLADECCVAADVFVGALVTVRGRWGRGALERVV